MASQSCNRCGDGSAAPVDCDRSADSVALCRQRVAREVRRGLVEHLAGLPSDQQRTDYVAAWQRRGASDVDVRLLNREVYQVMLANGHAPVAKAPPRYQAALI